MAFWHVIALSGTVYIRGCTWTHTLTYTMQGDNDSVEADLHEIVLKVPRVIEVHFCSVAFISVLDD